MAAASRGTAAFKCSSNFSLWSNSIASALRGHSTRHPTFPLKPLGSVRHASHAAQGRANGPKNGPGKRLGSKKTGGELVVPGNILYRQRGTKWFPGENVGMGRDHTLFAKEKGYVRYYDDPATPKRRYIGIVFEKHQMLPTPPNAPRRRRLNMLAIPRKPDTPELPELSMPPADVQVPKKPLQPGDVVGMTRYGTPLKMRSDYSFRESNIDLGRAMDIATQKVAPFKKGDRWLAWRKLQARKALNAERKSMAGASKKGKKGTKAKSKAKAKAKR